MPDSRRDHPRPETHRASPRSAADRGLPVGRLEASGWMIAAVLGFASVAAALSGRPGPTGPPIAITDAAASRPAASAPAVAGDPLPVPRIDVPDVSPAPVPARSARPAAPRPAVPAVRMQITTVGDDARARRAVDTALAQRGLPYVWGGDGPTRGDAGFDCSGLTTFSYGTAGVPLPRTAHTQFYAGPHVPDGAPLQPGDLVFYGTPSRVHHVGMYLGEGRMVNAPTFGRPVQVAFYRYRGDDYVGATRPSAGNGLVPGLLPSLPPIAVPDLDILPHPRGKAPDPVFKAPKASMPVRLPRPGDPAPPERRTAEEAIREGEGRPPVKEDPTGTPGRTDDPTGPSTEPSPGPSTEDTPTPGPTTTVTPVPEDTAGPTTPVTPAPGPTVTTPGVVPDTPAPGTPGPDPAAPGTPVAVPAGQPVPGLAPAPGAGVAVPGSPPPAPPSPAGPPPSPAPGPVAPPPSPAGVAPAAPVPAVPAVAPPSPEVVPPPQAGPPPEAGPPSPKAAPPAEAVPSSPRAVPSSPRAVPSSPKAVPSSPPAGPTSPRSGPPSRKAPGVGADGSPAARGGPTTPTAGAGGPRTGAPRTGAPRTGAPRTGPPRTAGVPAGTAGVPVCPTPQPGVRPPAACRPVPAAAGVPAGP